MQSQSQGKERIYLRELQLNRRGHKHWCQAGKQLVNRTGILDCTGADSTINLKELKLLFPPRSLRKLIYSTSITDFVDANTFGDNNHLAHQIASHLSSIGNKNNKNLSPSSLISLRVLVFFALVSPILFFGIKYLQFTTSNRVSVNLLTLGILSSPKEYKGLQEYLEERLVVDDYWGFLKGNKVRIIVDGDKKLKYQDARSRIARKEWDIAFTLSPMNSIAAKDNGYIYIGRMFPKSPAFYQSALYVRANSSIRSIDDFKSTTVIAMGEIGSASSFFMPAYDLYGKALTIKKDNRGRDILAMVKKGEADVGVGAFGTLIKPEDPSLHILQLSRNIPGSGVYLSPSLSEEDQKSIKRALLEAPKNIRESANYGPGPEPDYTIFRRIVQRVEETLSCSNFNKNPVFLFCSNDQIQTQKVANKSKDKPSVVGKINGYRILSKDSLLLNVSSQNGPVYKVFLTSRLLSQIPYFGSLATLQNKRIKLYDVIPKQLDTGDFHIQLEHINQFEIS